MHPSGIRAGSHQCLSQTSSLAQAVASLAASAAGRRSSSDVAVLTDAAGRRPAPGEPERKAVMARPRTQEEEDMRLITTDELTHRSDTELAVLFGMVSQSLVRSDRGTPERRNALASLENIGRARAVRICAGPRR